MLCLLIPSEKNTEQKPLGHEPFPFKKKEGRSVLKFDTETMSQISHKKMSNQQLLGLATAMMKEGNLEGLKTLQLSPVIDMFNDEAKTLLVVACEMGNLEMVRDLLKVGGVEVNKGYQDTGTALYNACEGGHLEIVRELLSQSGIDVNKGCVSFFNMRDVTIRTAFQL